MPFMFSTPGLHVLVAEDNPVNQRIAKNLLKNLGHTGVLVDNGQKALRCLAQQKFDLVLMDCMMPVLDGLQALAEIRAQEQTSGGRQKLIMVTAHTEPEDKKRMLQAGADGYIAKPMTAESLTKEIARLHTRPRGAPRAP